MIRLAMACRKSGGPLLGPSKSISPSSSTHYQTSSHRRILLLIAKRPGQGKDSACYDPLPPQYLHRKELAKVADPPKPKAAPPKTITDPPKDDEPVTFELDPKVVINRKVYGMYDFLGFFLSLAPAPDAADKETFFAP